MDLSQVKGSALVLSTMSAGMSAIIAQDLYIMNEKPQKLGYVKSEYISPMVQNGILSPGQLQMPCELYLSADKKYTFMMLRSTVLGGKMYQFGEALANFVKVQCGFSGVIVLSGTMSPVGRERSSNRDVPEIFGYCNNTLYQSTLAGGKSYYEKYQIRKFGWWLGADKKKQLQELKEMMGGGAATKLMKVFNKHDVPLQLFVMFTPGGIDFVGGFTYYNFLKTSFEKTSLPVEGITLGKPQMAEKTGEDVHETVFKSKKVATPEHWQKIIAYYF